MISKGDILRVKTRSATFKKGDLLRVLSPGILYVGEVEDVKTGKTAFYNVNRDENHVYTKRWVEKL